MIHQTISRDLKKLTLVEPPDRPKNYKGAINCGQKAHKCISNADAQWDDIYSKRMRNGVQALIDIVEDMNNQYLYTLGAPCKWYQFKCKKERKRLSFDQAHE